MLIATLPTIREADDNTRIARIMHEPAVDAARYNTGGDSPESIQNIVAYLKETQDMYQKTIYIDLDGRQTRVAEWTPYSRGSVVLNQDFEIELPGEIHFRGVGWFDIIDAKPEERKIYFRTIARRSEYYLGKSQSVHVLAKRFQVKGSYLNATDRAYVQCGCKVGLDAFMLSFAESWNDVFEFIDIYAQQYAGKSPEPVELILKIESAAGIELVKGVSRVPLRHNDFHVPYHLMAARDDLFLAYRHKRTAFLEALNLIIKKDPQAIVASKIMSGLEYGNEITYADMADVALMSQYGYKHFMLADELSHKIDVAVYTWDTIMKPIIEGHREV